ncbi:hypothetical protein FRC09_013765 [Ceratobasidium sp. 395]|nr:hypothetical protein FRC09_013765 [Ceratobasidium sp. 395]
MYGLRNLDIEFDRINANQNLHRLDSKDFFDVLSPLPLETVRMAGVQFTDLLALNLDEIFPAAAELRLPHQKADLNVLSRFAATPSLKHLAIAFSDWHGSTDWLSRTQTCCSSLETLELTVTPGEEDEDDDDEEAALPDVYPRLYIHTAAT